MTERRYFPFEQLEIYRLAVAFAVGIYRITEAFPRDERFGLTNQIRRAVVSISLNIAEGRGRGSDKDFARFLLIARGSLFEVIAACQIAQELHFLTPEQGADLTMQAHELSSKLMTLIKHLNASSP